MTKTNLKPGAHFLPWGRLPGCIPLLLVLAALPPRLALGAQAGPMTAAEAGRYTPLQAASTPKIVAAAEAFGANYNAENLLKEPTPGGGRRAEYASRGAGVRTFIDFDFGQPVRLAAFRHVQRRTGTPAVPGKFALMAGMPYAYKQHFGNSGLARQ